MYHSLSTSRVNESRVRWTEHAACMCKTEIHTQWRRPKRRRPIHIKPILPKMGLKCMS